MDVTEVPMDVTEVPMAVKILAAGLFVFLAHLLDVLFLSKKIPDILILMILGIIAGPWLGLVELSEIETVGKLVAVITLVVILFESGLNLSIGQVIGAARTATPFALLSMFGAVGLMTGIFSLILGLDLWTSLLGGFILGGTSSAVVIPLLKSLDTSEETGTVLTLESALTDVLCIIATVGIATSLADGEAVQAGGLLGNAVFSLLMAGILGLGAGVAWMVLTAKIERLHSNKFTTLAFALVIYGAGEIMEVSGAIIALSFGIALNNARKGRVSLPGIEDFELKEMGGFERHVYAEVVFLLKAFFFFYLGLSVEPGAFFEGLTGEENAVPTGLCALALALAPFIPRWPAVWLLFNQETTTRKEAMISWALVPRGLAAAVLAQYAAGLGLEHGDVLSRTVTMMVFLSITFVAIAIVLIERGILTPMGAVAFKSFPISRDGSGEPDEIASAEPAGEPEGEPATPQTEAAPRPAETGSETEPELEAAEAEGEPEATELEAAEAAGEPEATEPEATEPEVQATETEPELEATGGDPDTEVEVTEPNATAMEFTDPEITPPELPDEEKT